MCRLFGELSRGGDFLWPEEPGNVSQKDKFLHPLEFSNLTINFLYQSLTEGQLYEQIYILMEILWEFNQVEVINIKCHDKSNLKKELVKPKGSRIKTVL